LSLRFMLDTNIVSHAFKAHPRVRAHLSQTPMAAVCISAITEAEIRFGLAKRPTAHTLHQIATEFRARVDVLPWESDAAAAYGVLRAALKAKGRSLGNLDMLIAAHAIALGVTLVTNDSGFKDLPGLAIEDWTAANVS